MYVLSFNLPLVYFYPISEPSLCRLLFNVLYAYINKTVFLPTVLLKSELGDFHLFER